MSVTLDETVVINEENNNEDNLNLNPVFNTEEDSLGEERHSRDRGGTREINTYQEVFDGVPPINHSRRAVSVFHDNNIEVAIASLTPRLT